MEDKFHSIVGWKTNSSYYLKAGMTGAAAIPPIIFPYISSSAPYDVFVYLKATAQGSLGALCRADCSTLPASTSGAYFSNSSPMRASDGTGASCPSTSPCYLANTNTGFSSSNIAFDPATPTHIVTNATLGAGAYWRSPSIFQIP